MFAKLWHHFTYFIGDFWAFLSSLTLIVAALAYIASKIYKSKIPKQRKKIITSVVFTFMVIILLLLPLEMYFRYVYDVPDGLGFLKVSRKWVERHIIYNSDFYRDRNFQEQKQEGITRIGIMGDSITWGGGIENPEDRFSNILEKKLKEAGYKVEVYNLGRPGYDTQQETEEFEKVRHFNFDILIWEYFINDIQPSIKSTGSRIIETNRDLPDYITFFTNKSYFLNYLYWRLSPTHQKTFRQLRAADIAQYDNKEILQNHKTRITNFIKSFEGTNTKIVGVIFPSLLLIGPDYPTYIHRLMAEIFNQNGVQTLDLLPDFINGNKNELMASKFDPHPNETVHAIVAEKLFNYLKRQILKN